MEMQIMKIVDFETVISFKDASVALIIHYFHTNVFVLSIWIWVLILIFHAK